jgi:hypothetical protein
LISREKFRGAEKIRELSEPESDYVADVSNIAISKDGKLIATGDATEDGIITCKNRYLKARLLILCYV